MLFCEPQVMMNLKVTFCDWFQQKHVTLANINLREYQLQVKTSLYGIKFCSDDAHTAFFSQVKPNQTLTVVTLFRLL